LFALSKGSILAERGARIWDPLGYSFLPVYGDRHLFDPALTLNSADGIVAAVTPLGVSGQANPAVQLTATSHGLRHMISGGSITPSRLLLSHQSRRRSAMVSDSHFFQVAVADFVR